jgi:hypothetical protein
MTMFLTPSASPCVSTLANRCARFLTMLGIIIGVMSVVCSFRFVQSTTNSVSSAIVVHGSDLSPSP